VVSDFGVDGMRLHNQAAGARDGVLAAESLDRLAQGGELKGAEVGAAGSQPMRGLEQHGRVPGFERNVHFGEESRGGLASIYWRAVWYLSGQPFELNGADEVEGRMAPDRIVESVDVAPDRLLGFSPALEDGAPDQLEFQSLEEGLDNSVDAPMLVKRLSRGVLPFFWRRRGFGRFPARCSASGIGGSRGVICLRQCAA
jgi:hypothetical protein